MIKQLSNLKFLLIVCGLAMPMACSSETEEVIEVEQTQFASAEEARDAVLAALRADDMDELINILGQDAEDLVDSGDPVADAEDRERFLAQIDEKNELEIQEDGSAVLVVGNDEWPFPIPMVKEGDSWRFDTEEGWQEILDRRIGRNELETIEVCYTLVHAQDEYAAKDWDGDGVLEYAQKLRSAPDQRNGLYWPNKDDEEPSPMGALVAEASTRGYALDEEKAEPAAFNGYLYALITKQGPNAKGGAYEYMAGEHMIGGFAGICHPVEYGDSGIMTFIVSHSGVVYQKDLGEETAKLAAAIDTFDPDESWEAVEEK